MFVSAGRDLKFHTLDQKVQLSYKPNCNSQIKSISWAKDNGFLTFIAKKGLPEIISIKDPNNIKNVHTITSIDNASVIAFQHTTKRYLGIGAELGQVAIYDTRSKSISKLLQSTNSTVCCLDFSCDDKNMAICSKTGTVVIYDVMRGLINETYDVSSDCAPTAMKYHPSLDHLLAVALEDGTVTQWDTEIGKQKYSSKIHLAAVTGIVLIENSNLLLSVGIDNKFSIQDINTQQSTFCCNQPYPLTAMDVSADGITIAIGSEYGDIYLYDIRQLIKPLDKLKPHPSKVTKILFENKIKEEFFDDSSEFLSISTSGSREEIVAIVQPESLTALKPIFPKVMEHSAEKTFIKNKYCTPSRSSSKVLIGKMKDDEEVPEKIAGEIKKEIHQYIRKGKTKLEEHVKAHVTNLEKFMVNEFQTILDIVDEKFHYFTSITEEKLVGSSRQSTN